MKEIPLTKGYVALIDDEDTELVAGLRWFACVSQKPSGPRVYARANGKMVNWVQGSPVYLHRLIMSAPKGVMCDHINGNTLDNRRANLRLVTAAQNSMNSAKRSGPLFKGVYPSGRRFQVKIAAEGRQVHVGCFKTAEEGARAYDRAAMQFFGEFARLNFPHEIPDNRG